MARLGCPWLSLVDGVVWQVVPGDFFVVLIRKRMVSRYTVPGLKTGSTFFHAVFRGRTLKSTQVTTWADRQ